MTGILHPRIVASSLLESTDFFAVYVNPKVSGVVLPRYLYTDEVVVLHIGNRMVKPVVGLELDEYGFVAILSFNDTPFKVLVPWHAVTGVECLEGSAVAWMKPCEMGPLPKSFPGREKDGDNFWCPRRQRVVDDCAKHVCRHTECMYDVLWTEDALHPPRRAAVVPSPIVERRLAVIQGGKKNST